jgi:iron complex outermembrane receptor protein
VLGLLVIVTAPEVCAADDSDVIGNLKQLDVADLLNIEVTSVSRHAAPLTQAPSAIQVITGAQIRRSGATTLAEALRLADNLQVAQRGASGWAITARGFNTDLANKLLVMIDGRTVYTPLYSGVFWEAQDYLLEDIDRIEVISGPGGTLWGANAVNGVINIITREASSTQGLFAEAAAGSELFAAAGMRYGGTTASGLSYRAYGKHLSIDESVLSDGSGADDDWHREQAGFRMDSAPSSAGSWTLHGDLYSSHQQTSDGRISIMRGQNLLGRWKREPAEESSLGLQIYYDRTELSLPVAPLSINGIVLAPAGMLHDELQTLDLDFQHRLPVGARNTLTWGIGFRYTHDALDNAPAVAFLPAKLGQQLYSAFAQDELRLLQNLTLTVGSKVEHNDYTGYEFEPSARLQWLVGDQTIWTAVSRAVRAPSRIDRDLFQGPAPYPTILRGSGDFESENVVAYELGYRAQASARFRTSLATFYNEYDDVRSTTITPVTLLPFYFENGLAGHTWGAEWTGQLQLADNWSVQAGYVLLQEKLHVRQGHIDISNGHNETSDPEQQATLRSSMNLPGRIAVDLNLRWVDTLRNSNGPATGVVPAYVDLDARLAWQASPGLELALTGRNLLHDHHPEYGFPSAARNEIQRGVYAKLVWRQ